MIKPALDTRLGQRQRPTSCLQRSIQVLQASSQALQKEFALALASNPFLEEDDPDGTREFRSFFAGQIDVDSGPGYSAFMVQLDMWKMIESEPP